MKKLSDNQVLELVERYREGENLTCLSDYFRVTRTAITGLLKRRNVKIRNNLVKLTERQKTEIVNLYRGGMGTTDLAKKFFVSQRWVWQYVKQTVKITRGRKEANKKKRIHFFDESFFESIDNPNKAYVLGFVFADGCNTGRGLTIGLARKDEAFLKHIAALIGAQDMIKRRVSKSKGKKYPTVVLNLYSEKMSSDLEKQGAVKRKTLRLKFPMLPNRLIRHFVRGYFDGDGCVCVAKKRNRATLSIVGYRPFLSQMRVVMSDRGVSFIHLYRHSKKTSYLAVTHTKGLVQACRFLYRNGGIHLERKANKFREFFSRKGMQWPA